MFRGSVAIPTEEQRALNLAQRVYKGARLMPGYGICRYVKVVSQASGVSSCAPGNGISQRNGTELDNQIIKKISRMLFFFLLPMTLVFMTSACRDQAVISEPVVSSQKEILIYCGITMIRPMSEIAAIIEQQENCKVTITKGGSGNLLKSILHNQIGDLYLPGSDRYYSIIEEEHPGLVTGTVQVGDNRAVMMVQKGNPKNIPTTLASLADSAYAVVIGNPDSGSIGKETRKILERKGIFEDVVKNAIYMTTDSKDLVKTIIAKEADIVINWFAASTWDDNFHLLDVINIDPQYAKRKKLVIGLLKFSKEPALSRKFMALASSEQGRGIFKKYGLGLVKE